MVKEIAVWLLIFLLIAPAVIDDLYLAPKRAKQFRQMIRSGKTNPPGQ